MKSPYEIEQEREKIGAEKELNSILSNSSLSPNDLWKITDENFYTWTAQHYYPKFLEHLRVNFVKFEEWQRTWFLDDIKIIRLGISECLESKLKDKNPYKYIIEAKNQDRTQEFVSDVDLDGQVKEGGPYFTYYYNKKDSFIPYMTWIRYQNLWPSKHLRSTDIIGLKGKSSPNTQFVEIQILNNFTLLKMGGIKPPLNRWGLMNPKMVEFSNLDNLILTGEIRTANKEMYLKNCYIENLMVGDCDYGLVTFYNCVIGNLKIVNSKIQQWNFIYCFTSGDIINSELIRVNIVGGQFTASIRDSKLFEVEADKGLSENNFSECYKILKSAYSQQGDDSKSKDYYIKEKDYERFTIIKTYKANLSELLLMYRRSEFKFRNLLPLTFGIIKSHKFIPKYIGQTINYKFWGYGREPISVLINSLYIILLFSTFYLIQIIDMDYTKINTDSIINSINVSLSSFSTLGLFNPSVIKNINETMIIIESILGGLCIGAFIGSLANQKY